MALIPDATTTTHAREWNAHGLPSGRNRTPTKPAGVHLACPPKKATAPAGRSTYSPMEGSGRMKFVRKNARCGTDSSASEAAAPPTAAADEFDIADSRCTRSRCQNAFPHLQCSRGNAFLNQGGPSHIHGPPRRLAQCVATALGAQPRGRYMGRTQRRQAAGCGAGAVAGTAGARRRQGGARRRCAGAGGERVCRRVVGAGLRSAECAAADGGRAGTHAVC